MTSRKNKTPQESLQDETTTAGTPAGRVLRILTGVHAGARRDLAGQEMLLVGSGDDCDIVLADTGVARHHALINIADDVSSVRALDAPLRLDGRPVLPGDPVALAPLQRVGLGSAAIAFGAEDDAGWDTLMPAAAADGILVHTPAVRPALRRLPLIAALAVLSLASVAIFAAVMPLQQRKADPAAELSKLRQAYPIEHGRVEKTADGALVLRGTVRDAAMRDRIQHRMDRDGVQGASVDLRTGDKIASDVGEVLRASSGIAARARYLGNGNVEVSGRFSDEEMDKLREISHSRAMDDVEGVTMLSVNDLDGNDGNDGGDVRKPGAAPQPQPPEPVRIVAIVRGEDAHLVGEDGTRYEMGADLPGLGRLIAIGESAQSIGADGLTHKIKVQPLTVEEVRAKAAAAVDPRPEVATAESAGPAESAKADTAAAPVVAAATRAGSQEKKL